MTTIQSLKQKEAFQFVSDMNGHHQDCLVKASTDRHVIAVLNFSSVLFCNRLVAGVTHQAGGVLDCALTDVPDLVRPLVVAPTVGSDHSPQ